MVNYRCRTGLYSGFHADSLTWSKGSPALAPGLLNFSNRGGLHADGLLKFNKPGHAEALCWAWSRDFGTVSKQLQQRDLASGRNEN